MEELLKWLNIARKKPFVAITILLLSLMICLFMAYMTGLLNELGCRHASAFPSGLFVVTEGPHHIGDEIRDDYPVEKEGRILEKTFGFQLKARPKTATLMIEAFDVDLYGVHVFVNHTSIGKLRIGDPWQETQLKIPPHGLNRGVNTVTIRSETHSKGKVEDCLFRNVRVAVEY